MAFIAFAVANTAFVKSGPLLNLLEEIAPGWQTRDLRPHEFKALDKLVKGNALNISSFAILVHNFFILGLKVTTTQRLGKRSARCVAVTRQNAGKLT